MDKSIKLSPAQPLSKMCLDLGLSNFETVFNFVKALPYGRTKNRDDYTQVLLERKGTCSTKHAFLKAIAIENNIDDLKLCLGIFEMNAENTPKIKSILEQYQLQHIPEAHCYLKHNDTIIDITFNSDHKTKPSFSETLLYEVHIEPRQIGAYKVTFHKSFLKTWIKNEQLRFSLKQLWNIREACILALTE